MGLRFFGGPVGLFSPDSRFYAVNSITPAIDAILNGRCGSDENELFKE
jgi:hypothetical protein